MGSKNKVDVFKRCQWELENRSQCPNYFKGEGKYCYGHPPGNNGGARPPEGPKPPDKGPSNGAAWVGAISSLFSAVAASLAAAWPHVEPWIKTHIHYFSRLGQLLDDVIATGESGLNEVSHLDFTARYKTLNAEYDALKKMLINYQDGGHTDKPEILSGYIDERGNFHITGKYDVTADQLKRDPVRKEESAEQK